jgi:hypothetical protein
MQGIIIEKPKNILNTLKNSEPEQQESKQEKKNIGENMRKSKPNMDFLFCLLDM